MKNNILYAIALILVITQIMSYFKIAEVENRLVQATDELARIENNIDNQISSISSNIDEKLEEQASNIEYVETQIGEPNLEDLSVPITYTVIPKQVREETAISLDFEGTIKEMDRQGNTFSTTIVSKIFNKELRPDIIISEGNITKTEKKPDIYLNSLKEEIFPYLYVSLMGSSRSAGKKYESEGTIIFDVKGNDQLQGNIKYKSARLVVQVDGKIISDKAIDINKLDGYSIDEKVELKEGQTCKMIVIIKDSLNLEHHVIIDEYIQGNNAQRDIGFENEQIYSSDGKLLWKQN
ncbi:MAG: hypothetical protein ACK5MV_08745 [Aminipila sp.]